MKSPPVANHRSKLSAIFAEDEAPNKARTSDTPKVRHDRCWRKQTREAQMKRLNHPVATLLMLCLTTTTTRAYDPAPEE
jgi:hypothetical protein